MEPDFPGPLDLHHASFVDPDLHHTEAERPDLFAQRDKPVRLASGCGSEGGRIRRVEVRFGHDEGESILKLHQVNRDLIIASS